MRKKSYECGWLGCKRKCRSEKGLMEHKIKAHGFFKPIMQYGKTGMPGQRIIPPVPKYPNTKRIKEQI